MESYIVLLSIAVFALTIFEICSSLMLKSVMNDYIERVRKLEIDVFKLNLDIKASNTDINHLKAQNEEAKTEKQEETSIKLVDISSKILTE